jgi:hypothetical protein
MKRRSALGAALALAVLLRPVTPCLAGDVKLQIQNGLVTLEARDASAREILTEWARVGQTKMVNVEKIAGGPLTLQLAGVPERQALDVILRSVSGYVAAPRRTSVPGASVYDRILVLATPRQTAQVATESTPAPQPARGPRGGRDMPAPNDDTDEADMPGLVPGPGMGPGQPGRPFMNPGMGPQGYPGAGGSSGTQSTPTIQTPASSPFSAPPGSSPIPGVVVPVTPSTPGQQPTRPPNTPQPEES